MASMWVRPAGRATAALAAPEGDDDVGLTPREDEEDEEVGAVPLDSPRPSIMIF
jgi:hypothetical protein